MSFADGRAALIACISDTKAAASLPRKGVRFNNSISSRRCRSVNVILSSMDKEIADLVKLRAAHSRRIDR